MSLTQIVITGGPCAGKTTCMSVLEQRLTEKGYKVIVAAESATELILSGVRPSEMGQAVFERLLIEWQLAKEKVALRAADFFPKVVLLLDRGIPDCAAYVSEADYLDILASQNIKKNEAWQRYDAVLHLVTAADGAEEFYNCQNNVARQEKDLQTARLADKRTQSAYVGHPHLRVIDNSTDFEGKVNRLCHEVFSVLGLPIPLEIERKFLIDRPSEADLLAHGAVPQKIVQAYLKPNGDTERRIRERGDENGFACYYTEKRTISPTQRVEKEEKISLTKYMSLLTEAEHILTKTRWCFLEKGQYFELDIFDAVPDRALLEIELTNENQQIELPDWCEVIQEVTDKDDYRNYSIAQKGFPR